ncbi:hypothetical protein SVA_3456 [Sulfurifustis variabilis]|uniref:Uncharacterized protein n=1 Tax=Sulfurifustis variabilis TaxID=1675686 RepID=A0A1C7AFC4_9GAMM|nr:hypothetical protein [Sulfurifustis variabilis]BAU49992.1 hypothetical protein SVA_3456 [Sulfurifustis variabilis]
MAAGVERTPLRTYPKQIDAACYNHVRLALLRFGAPLRVGLPRHRGLEVILDDDLWLCVDAAREDTPVLAWFDFETRGRSSLHAPVACRLDVYHVHAGLVMGTTLDALTDALRLRLAAAAQGENHASG